jgi:hypothetical protein
MIDWDIDAFRSFAPQKVYVNKNRSGIQRKEKRNVSEDGDGIPSPYAVPPHRTKSQQCSQVL